MRNVPELPELMGEKKAGAIEKVFEAIRKEREYQNRLWGGTQEEGIHSVTEYLVFIQDYVQEALHICSRKAAPYCDQDALHIMRKVAAMAVACMEQNGIEQRDMGDLDKSCELHSVKCEEVDDKSIEELKDEEQEICEALAQPIEQEVRKTLLQELKAVQQQLRDLRNKGARYGY